MASSSALAIKNVADDASFEVQHAQSSPVFQVHSKNFLADLNSSHYIKPLRLIVEVLKNSVLAPALTLHKSVPQNLVNLAFSSAKVVTTENKIMFDVYDGKNKIPLEMKKTKFIKLLDLRTTGLFVVPEVTEMINMFNQMGYNPFMTKLSQFRKNRLPMIWYFFFTILKRCLGCRKSSKDYEKGFLMMLYGIFYNVPVDYGSILWNEFVESLKPSSRDTEISSHRFWSIILDSAYRAQNIKILFTDDNAMPIQEFPLPTKFGVQQDFIFVSRIPDTMLSLLPGDNELKIEYLKKATGPMLLREIPKEIQAHISKQMVREKVSKKRPAKGESSNVANVTKEVKQGKVGLKRKAPKLIDEEDSDDFELVEVEDAPIEKDSSVRITESSVRKSLKKIKVIVEDDEETYTDEKVVQHTTDVVNVDAGQSSKDGQSVLNTAIVNVDKVDNVENVDAVENVENVDRIENVENVDRVENVGNVNRVEDVDAVENMESDGMIENVVENIENVEGRVLQVEDVLDVGNAEVQNQTDVDEGMVSGNEGPIVQDDVAENVGTPPSTPPHMDSTIFGDLPPLNVPMPQSSPVITKAPTSSEQVVEQIPTTIIHVEYENVEKDVHSSSDSGAAADGDDFQFGPIDIDDPSDDEVHDQQFMTIKEYKILVRKMNSLIRKGDAQQVNDIANDKRLVKELAASFQKNLDDEIVRIDKSFELFKYEVRNTNKALKDEVEKLGSSLKGLVDGVGAIKSEFDTLKNDVKTEYLKVGSEFTDLKKQMEPIAKNENMLRTFVEAVKTKVDVMESFYNSKVQKESMKGYEEKVLSHLNVMQQDFLAQFDPIFTKLGVPKIDSSSKQGGDDFVKTKEGRIDFAETLKKTAEHVLSKMSEDNVPKQKSTFSYAPPKQTTLVLEKQKVSSSVGTSVGTSHAGTSSKDKGKAKIGIEEISENEVGSKVDKNLFFRQDQSLRRQEGNNEQDLTMKFVSKTWDEATIKSVAFCDEPQYEIQPKEHFIEPSSEDYQLDMPTLPLLFTVKVFILPPNVELTEDQYNDKLIGFYANLGKNEKEVWSLKKIKKLRRIEYEGLFEEVFINKRFFVLRDNNDEINFTLADLPSLNPSDLFVLLKVMLAIENYDSRFEVHHLRALLRKYYDVISDHDTILAKMLKKQISQANPNKNGISKLRDGKILYDPEWGIVVNSRDTKRNTVKRFFCMRDRGLYQDPAIKLVSERVGQCAENTVKQANEVQRLLNWTILFRNELLDNFEIVFGTQDL